MNLFEVWVFVWGGRGYICVYTYIYVATHNGGEKSAKQAARPHQTTLSR